MSTPTPEASIPSTPAAASDKALIDVPGDDNAPLQPPPTLLANRTPSGPSLRDSLAPSGTTPLVPETEKNLEGNVVAQPDRRGSLLKRPIFWLVVAAAVVAVVLAVILPVYFTVIKPKNNTAIGGGGNNNNNNTGDGGSKPPPKPTSGLTTGGDGSTVTMENGTTFTYQNPFGGFCAHIPVFSRMVKGTILTIESRRGLGSGKSVQ